MSQKPFSIQQGANLKFISTYEICPLQLDLRNVISQVEECKNDCDQKKLLDRIILRYRDEQKTPVGIETRKVLMELFIRLGAKKSLRKHVFEKLSKEHLTDSTLFDHIVTAISSEIFAKLNDEQIFNTSQCLHLLNFLFTFTQNFQSDVTHYETFMEKTKTFYLCTLHVLTSQLHNQDVFEDRIESILKNDDVYTILDYTLKHLLTVSAKVNKCEVIGYNVEFAGYCHEILKVSDQLKYETCAKCALLMAYFLNSLDDADKEFIKYKEIPILDYVSDANLSLKFKDKLLDNVFITDKMKLVLYAAIVNSLEKDKEKLFAVKVRNKSLFEFLYVNFIEFARKMTGYPDQIILIARTLSEMSENLDKIPMDTVFDEGIQFAWAHLDHFVESVVHCTKLFFKKLVHLSADFYFSGGEKRYLENLFQTLNSMSRFSKVRLCALEIVCGKVEPQFVLATFNDLQQYLISVIPDTDMGQLAGNTYIQIMLRHANDLSSEEFTSIWVRPVMDILRLKSTENTSVFQRIVTCGIQKKPLIFRQLFPAKYIGNSAESIIILRCVNVARTKGMVFPIEPDRNRSEYWRDLILKKMLELFMIHQDEEVRLWALQVVVECQKSTEEFFEWEVLYLLSYFSYNVSTQLSSVRKKISAFYKKIFQRYQASYNVVLKKITIEQSKKNVEMVAHYERVKKYYRGFLTQFINLLSSNLAPDSNHSRRSLSLELLLVIREYSGSIEWRRCLTQDDVVNLLNVLNDSFEGNKAMAVSVLKCLPSSVIGFENEKQTRAYFDRCLEMACDMKPNTTLTASYMLQVVLQSQFPFKLELRNQAPIIVHDFRYFLIVLLIDRLQVVYGATKDDIAEGIAITPFHGLLLGIRTLLSSRNLKEYNHLYVCVFEKMMELCEEIKKGMMPIVCIPAPEGHLPDSSEETLNIEICDDNDLLCQMNLVAAWKTMKEIMLLLAEIVKQTVFLETDYDMVRIGELENIGNFFLDIFITTKHRGVFEQAGSAFAVICQEFVKSKYEQTSELPMKWLDDAISLCTGKKTDERLCSTRRSAGLPFLILSIVSTQAENNIVYFQKTMEQLLLVANNTSENNDELRTHCLNILRFMFLNSKLGDLVPSYIGSAAIAALMGFESKTWPVRNSSTLLYAALITRIFGVQRTSDSEHLSSKNRLTLAVFHMRYPKLFDFLLKTLAEECDKANSLILHPVLLILARLYPSHNDKVNEKVDKHVGFIATCLGNCSHRTRDLAARASVSLIPAKFVTRHLADGFRKIAAEKNISNSECHGVLLQMWHLLKMNKIYDSFEIGECLEGSLHVLEETRRRFSHSVVSLYMEVVSLLLIKFRDFESFESFKHILRLISNYQIISTISTARSSLIWNRFCLTLCILINKFPYIRTTFNIITKEIIGFLYGEDLRLKRNCLFFLIYLNQLCSHQEFKEHPLIESGEVEIPEAIIELVNSFSEDSRKQLLTSTHKILVYFFYGQLKNQTIHNQDCLVLVFLLLNYYPCVYCQIHLDSKQEILDLLLNIATKCDSSEELVSSVISCTSRFILTLDFDDLKTLEYSRLIRALMRSAAPSAAYFRRLSVAQFLVVCQEACRDSVFQDLERYNLLNIIMVLLEDEERYIRNTMSTYPAKEKRIAGNTVLEVIPDKARSDLMVSSVSMLRHQVAVCFLTSWSLRYLPEVTTNPSFIEKKKVYDRTDLNMFAENIPVTYSACKVLNSLLWPLENSLNYEDKSIFLEEQTLLVTTIILNALIKLPSPMMDKYTKTVVICALKCVAKYLEEYSIGNEFQKNFKTFFANRVLKYLRTSLRHDYSSVKFFFTYVYNPVLKTNMKLLLK